VTPHPPRQVVAGKLGKRWSPAQISRWLQRRYPRRTGWHVCAETIYEGVYRGLIIPAGPASLRTGRIYRHHRGRGRSREGALRQSTNMKSIRERPPAAESRRQAGHWEGDLIVGAAQRSVIATLVERKTRHTVLVGLPGDHSAQPVGDALIGAFAAVPSGLCRMLTWDQGNEMFQLERIEQATGLKIYFADPHSPWQRGSNENTNGLGFYRWLRILIVRGSHAKIRVEQDAARGQGPLLRADQNGVVGVAGCRACGRVAQLRVAVVHRRWQRELRRDAGQP